MLALVRQSGLAADEREETRRRARQLIDEVLAEGDDEPEPDGQDGGRNIRMSPSVSRRTDKAKNEPAGAHASALHLVTKSVQSAKPTCKNTEEKREKRGTTTDIYVRDCPSSPVMDARRTLAALESVGASQFKVVFLGVVPVGAQAQCLGSEDVTGAQARARIVGYITRSEQKSVSVCLRPMNPAKDKPEAVCVNGALIQIDDCSAEEAAHLKPLAFLIIQTSPGSFQVWLCLPAGTLERERLDVRERLLRKFKETGSGANGGAYNSLRLPGCLNAKEKYQASLGEFPRVALIHAQDGRTVTAQELDGAGLLASPKVQPILKATRFTSSVLPKSWPDYYDYLNRSGTSDTDKPDRSNADICFAMASLRAGWPAHMVASEIDRLSSKAQGRHDSYAQKTVGAAERFIAQSPPVPAYGSRATSGGSRARVQI